MSCFVHRTRQQRRVAHGGPADWMGRRLRGTCLQIEQVEQVRQVQQVEDSYYFNSRTSMGDWTDVVFCFVYSQGASYDPSGMNYRCPCCDKQTRTMQASFFYFTYGQLDRRRDDLFTGAHAAHEREDAVQVGGVRHRAEHGAARVLM